MSRAKFKTELIQKMKSIDYEYYPFSNDIRFIKRIDGGFYNILFLTFNRYDIESFTGDFFLSLYPSDIYEEHGKKRKYRCRISRFLNSDEKTMLLNHKHNNVEKSGGDGWWYKTDDNCIDSFVRAVFISENRFLEQENIFEEVINNEILRWYYNKETLQVIKCANLSNLEQHEFFNIPKTDIHKIGMRWFKGAELFIKTHSDEPTVRKYRVNILAAEAYMTDKYEKIYGPYNPILLELKQKSYDEFFNKKNST